MPMGYVDLHLHTTASDGVLSPSEIVRYAKAKGLQAIAITKTDPIPGEQVNTDLALTLFGLADFITKKTDHTNANNMHDEPSAVKKLKSPG